MSINATSNQRAYSTTATAAEDAKLNPGSLPGAGLMSPDDIIAYVRFTLQDIGGQMQDIKDKVRSNQERAREIREIQALYNGLTSGGGDHHIPEGSDEYNKLMNLLEKYKDDPILGKAYHNLHVTVGTYTTTDGQAVVPSDAEAFTEEQKHNIKDRLISNDEAPKIGQFFQDALAELNSDNELVMMDLQKLAQQRNQASQFASNMLNSINEGTKAVIGNIR